MEILVDFEMTNSGDMKLSATEKLPCFNIKWYESEFPVFQIKWEQQEVPASRPSDERFTLSFHTISRRTSETKAVRPVRHERELIQRIAILLRTEIGSCRLSRGLGTTLSLDKHKDIRDIQVLQSIQGKIISAIDGLVENPAVVLKVEEKDGPFYCQNVNVYIYQNDELLYETHIGG